MEEHNAVSLSRQLSDESTDSSDYEYYQTEIFDQLPSVQATRAEQYRPEEQLGHGHLSRGAGDKAPMQPLRNLAMCIQGKRDARNRRKMQTSDIGFWVSWRQSQSINIKRVWEQIGGGLANLLPWQQTLRVVQGRFGVGVKDYFAFLRYLIFLNILYCALISGFILGPTAFYGRGNNSERLVFGGNDTVLNFVLGKGYLNRSPVFFAFYTPGSLDFLCLNTPLLYLTGILIILFLSVIMVVRRTIVGYKHTWMLGKRQSLNVSYKIFCGWDFTIQDPPAANLKHSFIRNDLKRFVAEQKFSKRVAQRTFKQRAHLYLLRFILNVLVLSLLGGAFSLIFFTTRFHMVTSSWLVGLLLQYLPPFTMSFVNLFLPHIFRKISSFEDYSFTMQVNITLVRSIFLKLASLGIFVVSVIKTRDQPNQCRENEFGREMYKLCIFNFLTTFCNAFLLNYPRKLLLEKYPSCLLSRLSGKQHFLIPFNVLDLVYAQTVSWLGVYYCPLLPLIGVVILILTFYIKKFTVLRCCVAEQRMIRASSSSVLFHFMLLLGLLMAATTLGFDLYQNRSPSCSSCGPFGNKNVFNVTAECVESLPSLAQSTLRYLASEAFAIPLILAEIIILTSYVSRGRANQKAIERLKDMLVMSSSDKRFLVKQHTTMLRRQKNPR